MRRVLIIEDNEDQAVLAMRLLRKENIAAVLASRFEEGLQRDHSTDFDCVILDASLPDLSTPYDTVARIREFRAPIVIWTGSTDHNLIKAVRQTGASFVGKPGGDLLVEKVWSQINFRNAAIDSELGQQDAQRRLQEAAIKESTPVTFTLQRLFIIIGFIIAGTISITAVVLTKVGEVDRNVSATRADIAEYKTIQKEQAAATQKRIQEWTKWRYGVSHDLRRLGDGAKIQIETNPDNDP